MRRVRALLAVAFPLSLLTGCLTMGIGCGDGNSGSSTQLVKDSPLTPEQQTAFDKVYKQKPSKRAGR